MVLNRSLAKELKENWTLRQLRNNRKTGRSLLLWQKTQTKDTAEINEQIKRNEKHHARVVAFINSAKKRGATQATDRYYIVRQLRRARENDEKRRWGMSFHAGLSELKKYYKMDLVEEIRQHQKQMQDQNYTILEIGCGIGNAASGLEKYVGHNTKIIATGVKKIKEWKTQENSDKITWKVTHGRKLTKTIPPNSVNFIHSNLGIGHANNPYEALMECAKLLKKGGKILFTTDNQEDLVASGHIPKEFKILKETKTVIGVRYDQMAPIQIIYLEKIRNDKISKKNGG